MHFPPDRPMTAVMSPFDSSLELAPGRRTSLLTKQRPITAHGIPLDMQDFDHRRNSGLPALHPDVEDYLMCTGQLPDWAKQPSMARLSTSRPGERTLEPDAVHNTPRHTRRTSSIGQSLKHGVAELRSLGRRMSASVRGKSGRSKTDLSDDTSTTVWSPEKDWRYSVDSRQATPLRPRSRGYFRASSSRRRPSLPLLDFSAEPCPPRYSIHGPVPGGSRGPPILPEDLFSGAGARAAAAAQNEALQANRSAAVTTDYLQNRLSEMKLARDSESGIGIVVHNGRTSSMIDSDVIKVNPTTVLPPELTESIFRLLDPKSLLESAAVSQEWRAAATSQTVWRHVFYREYSRGGQITSNITSKTARGLGKNVPNQDWRKLFRVRRQVDQRWSKGEAAAIYLKGHKDSVYCVQFDEQKIITGSRDNTIRVWDTHTYQCVRKLGFPNNPRERKELHFEEPDPKGLKPLCVLDTKGPDPPAKHTAQQHHSASILCLQYDDEILVTGSSDFTAIVWDIKDDYRPIHRLRGHKAGVLDVCIDQQRIITCSKDTTIKIWDRCTGALLHTLTGHRGPVNAVQVRGNLLASASGDGMSKLWRLEDGMCIKEFSSRDRGLACVEFSEDGRTIFAGGNDQIIYEYDTVTGTTVRQMKGHKDLVRSLHLDSANGRIVSGSYDLSVKVWDSGGKEDGLKIDFQGWTTSWMLSAKSDYRKIVCTSQDGRVLIVDFGYGLEGVDDLEA